MTAYEKFNNVKTAYLSSLSTIAKSKNTYDKYARVINDFAKWLEQNDCEETDITAVMIINYSKTVKERGDKNNTLRDYLTVLHVFFEWTVSHKFYKTQPVLAEDIPGKEGIEYDLLTEEQIDTVLEGKIPRYAHKGIRNRALVIMFLQSGLRVSELANLRIEDIDFEQGAIRVKRGKGDKFRYSTLPSICQKYLKEYLQKAYGDYMSNRANLVFPSVDRNGNQKPYTRQNLTKVVRGYIRNLVGKDYIGAHDLRHAFASELLTQGASLEQIQQVLGHSSYATTVIYASHLCPNRIVGELNSVFDKKQEIAKA